MKKAQVCGRISKDHVKKRNCIAKGRVTCTHKCVFTPACVWTSLPFVWLSNSS